MDDTVEIIVICLGFAVVLFSCLCIFLLLHGKNRLETQNKIAASIMIAHAICALIFSAGKLHMDIFNRAMARAFCYIYIYFEITFRSFVPVSLFIFTVERLMFVRDPIGYNQKLTRIGVVVMVLFPWIFALVLATLVVISTYNDGWVHLRLHSYDFYGSTNATKKVCYLSSIGLRRMILYNIDDFLLGVQAITSLICSITVLVMWCSFKCKHAMGMDYALMGEEIEKSVKHSVIAICVVNLTFIFPFYIAIVVLESFYIYGLADAHPLLIFGVIEGVVFICTCKGTCGVIPHLCCKRNPAGNRVTYYKDNAEVDIGD